MSQFPFQRLQIELAKMINSLPAESRLPSEPHLAKKMGVSRATLREAMRAFEGQGLIRRRQGVGTFVMAKVPVLDTGLEVLESIETTAQRSGLSVTMGALLVEDIEADQELADLMKIDPGANLTRVSRVIYTGDRPIAFLLDTLPVDVLSRADMQDGFSGSVLDLLLRRGKPKLVQSRSVVNAISASPEVARALQIQRDDVLLHFSAQLFTETGRMVDRSNSYFLPGYFRFHVVRRVG